MRLSVKTPETRIPTPPEHIHVPPKPKGGAIAGGTAAGVVVVALGILGAIILRKRRQRRKSECPQDSRDTARAEEFPAAGIYTGHGGGEKQYDHNQEGKDLKTPDFPL